MLRKILATLGAVAVVGTSVTVAVVGVREATPLAAEVGDLSQGAFVARTTNRTAAPPRCHRHTTEAPNGPDTYMWQVYGAHCRVKASTILIEWNYPQRWTRARVKQRCIHVQGDFSPVSHHGRNCYDIRHSLGVRECHQHNTPHGVVMWKPYFQESCINLTATMQLNEFNHPIRWTSAQVWLRCHREGGTFERESHHGRMCRDIFFFFPPH